MADVSIQGEGSKPTIVLSEAMVEAGQEALWRCDDDDPTRDVVIRVVVATLEAASFRVTTTAAGETPTPGGR